VVKGIRDYSLADINWDVSIFTQMRQNISLLIPCHRKQNIWIFRQTRPYWGGAKSEAAKARLNSVFSSHQLHSRYLAIYSEIGKMPVGCETRIDKHQWRSFL
jgi:hypothetical protein